MSLTVENITEYLLKNYGDIGAPVAIGFHAGVALALADTANVYSIYKQEWETDAKAGAFDEMLYAIKNGFLPTVQTNKEKGEAHENVS